MNSFGWQELLIIAAVIGLPVAAVVLVVVIHRHANGAKPVQTDLPRAAPSEPSVAEQLADLKSGQPTGEAQSVALPEGVRIYEPQGVIARLAAWVIDIAAVAVPMALIYAGLSEQAWATDTIFGISVVVLFSLYFIVLEALFGATLGKKVLGMVVLSEGENPCGWGRAIARNIMKLLAMGSLLGLFVTAALISASAKRQRLGDRLAKTVVVKDVTPSAVHF